MSQTKAETHFRREEIRAWRWDSPEDNCGVVEEWRVSGSYHLPCPNDPGRRLWGPIVRKGDWIVERSDGTHAVMPGWEYDEKGFRGLCEQEPSP